MPVVCKLGSLPSSLGGLRPSGHTGRGLTMENQEIMAQNRGMGLTGPNDTAGMGTVSR